MRLDAHQQRAEQLEHALTALGDPTVDPDMAPGIIEMYWGAGFHWIAYGCEQKHGKHKENHSHLARYLKDLGEPAIGAAWDRLESTRQGAMYAYHAAPDDVARARMAWQEVRTWALT
jgi:hypothetical protein